MYFLQRQEAVAEHALLLKFVISKILKEINPFIQQRCIKCIELSVYQRIRKKYVLWLAQKYETAQYDNIKKCFLSSKSAY